MVPPSDNSPKIPGDREIGSDASMHTPHQSSESIPSILGAVPESRFDLRFPVLGIDVRVHPSFWLTASLFAWQGNDLAATVTGLVCVLASVLFHELGHAGLTRYFDRWPAAIVLGMAGGRPTMVKVSTLQNLMILLAGPVSGLLLAAVAFGVGQILVLPTWLLEVAGLLVVINLTWSLINLLPVLPLDGGQLAAAVLHRSDSHDGGRRVLTLSTATSVVVAVAGYWIGPAVGINSGVLPVLFGVLAYQNAVGRRALGHPVTESLESIGDMVTNADVERTAPEFLKILGKEGDVDDVPGLDASHSLGDQATSGDFDSPATGVANLSTDTPDVDGEMVDLDSRYEVLETLGQGGMGEVLRARDKRLMREVAIKRLKEDLGASRRAMQRFLVEAQAIATLNHYNIVQIYDYGRAVDGPFIVMELVDGPPLSDRLREGALDQETAVEMMDQLCQALSLTHAQGVVHRDIKPANVMVTAEGIPKLTDFGLARQEVGNAGQTQAGAVLGTLDYMPPEQKDDASRADARSDLWSLAVMFYQMLTGEVPGVIRPDRLPDELVPVLLQALEQAPDDRYQTADELREAIHTALLAKPTAANQARAVGDCPFCGHNNEDESQFCESCGEPLLVPCYSCQVTVKPWATFCNVCGIDLVELMDTRLRELQEQQQAVRSLRGEYRHTDAIELVGRLALETHPQFSEFRDWAEEREKGLRRELQELEQRRTDAFQASETAMAENRFEEVIRLLESLPTAVLRDPERQLLAAAKQRVERLEQLFETIRKATQERQIEGLGSLVDEYLTLRPDDSKILSLREQLVFRDNRQQQRELGLQIRNAVAAGEYDELLPLVQDFLALSPDDERMQRLGRQLQAREEQQRQQQAYEARRALIGRGIVLMAVVAAGAVYLQQAGHLPQLDRDTPARQVDQHIAQADIPELVETDDKVVPDPGTNTADKSDGVTPTSTTTATEKPAAPETEDSSKPGDISKPAPDRPAVSKELVHTLEGSEGAYAVAFSPDGTQLAATHGSAVKVWNVELGAEELTLEDVDNKDVVSLSFSPDGKRLASTCGTMGKVWDMVSGRVVVQFEGHTESINSVAFNPDGKRLVSAGDDRLVKVWNTLTGEAIVTMKGHSGEVHSVSFSPDGRSIASASGDKTMRVWDVASGEILSEKKKSHSVRSLVFSPDSKRLASIASSVDNDKDGVVSLYDTAGRTLGDLKGHRGRVTGVAFSPTGRWLASTGVDSTVRVWDVSSRQELLTLKGHSGPVTCVAICSDHRRGARPGCLVASASEDKTVRVWKLEEGSLVAGSTATASSETDQTTSEKPVSAPAGPRKPVVTLSGHDAAISSVSFHPDGRRLASASDDNSVKIWDVSAGKELATLQGHEERVYSVRFSPNGKKLATAGGDNKARIWDAETGKELLVLTGHSSDATGLAFNSDGRRLATASLDGKVNIWDTDSGALVLSLTGGITAVNSVAFSPDDKLLCSADRAGILSFWSTKTGKRDFLRKGHTKPIFSVAFSPDSKWLVSGSSDQTIRLWHLKKRYGVPLKGHRGGVLSVAIGPNGRRVASASADATVKVWNLVRGGQPLTLKGHKYRVNGVAFSPDGRQLASAGKDIKIWRLFPLGSVPTTAPRQETTEETRKPSSAIDGTWKIVSATISGKLSNSHKGRMLSFAEGKAELDVQNPAAIEYRFSYVADTRTKPAAFRVFKGERLLMSGIYRHQGKLLQLCFVRGEKTLRPENFTAKGIGHQLYVLEPVKTP